MNFYTRQHTYYCGIDLHAKAMYVCILDHNGTKLVHKNLPTTPEAFLRVIAPYREEVVVGVECIFTWYWLADLCSKEGIAFVLGHALYMKASHGGKAKNDKIAALRISCYGRSPKLRLSFKCGRRGRCVAVLCNNGPNS
jgi:transposase